MNQNNNDDDSGASLSNVGLDVAEHRDQLTENALQIVEMDAHLDALGCAAHRLRFEVLRLRRLLENARTLTNGESVRIPTSEPEAVLMVNMGMQYLRDYAPHRIVTAYATGEARPK